MKSACRVQWLRGRASDSRRREPGFKSCAVVLKPWASLFTLHCSSSLSCINECLAIDSASSLRALIAACGWKEVEIVSD